MTPNFALSLSFDGIRLMHRTAGGWNLIGEVALDVPNLNAEMANLRRTALALDPAGLRTKLLLPNEQIKYLAIETTQTSIEDIHAVLDGATPYAVNELAIDFDRSGGRTHIAAVARETLVEAEAFAAQYKFGPVCFAAVADPLTFSQEVFFGPTTIAKDLLGPDQTVERDAEPVKIIGHATMPTPPKASEAMPLTMRATPEPDPTPEPAPKASEPILTFGRDRSPEQPKTKDPDTPSQPKQDAPKPVSEPESAAKPTASKPAKPILPPIDEPVFTSRLSILGAERSSATPDPADPPRAAPAIIRKTEKSVDPATDHADETAAPLFTRRPETPAAAAPKETPKTPDIHVAEPDAPAVPRPIVMADLADTVQAASVTGDSPAATPKPTAAPAAPRTKPKPEPVAVSRPRGKPRFLALKLTAALLVFLALVAIWASFLTEDGIAGWFNPQAEVATLPPTVLEPTPDTAAEIIVTDEDVVNVSPAIAPEGSDITERTAPPVPIVTTSRGRVLSPGEADRIYAATGVWQRAPRVPSEPLSQELIDLAIIAAPEAVTPAPRQQQLIASEALPDLPLLPQLNPPAFGANLPRDADGFLLAAATGTVMPHGVLVYARKPGVIPPLRPTPVIAEPETEVAAPPDTPPTDEAVTAPVEEGLIVITGKPPVQPPLRPGTVEVAPEEAAAPETAEPEAITPGAVSIAAFRPSLRPDGLAPEAPEEPFADPALAGLRPSIRPAGLAPAPSDAPAIDDAVAEALTPQPQDISSVIATIAAAAPPSPLINPTQRAIVASPRPDTRPANFSRVVASAQQLQQRQETSENARQTSSAVVNAPAATPVASASVAPTGAIPGSVAQAATTANVISLRNVNLIGVYGRPRDRRALIRLANGRYVKVEVGSAFEGGKVTAISDNALNYVVRGQTYYLALPTG